MEQQEGTLTGSAEAGVVPQEGTLTGSAEAGVVPQEGTLTGPGDPGVEEAARDGAALREAVASVPTWYHTLELAPGVVTPGWFDLRPVAHRLPWPHVEGRRCLDVGTYDGFLAFELERRGAAEVVALDIGDHASWDWPTRLRARGLPDALATIVGSEKGRGFAIARAALRSRVERLERSVYELDPAIDGRFDVVVCGSLLLHLRDPLRALQAILPVCAGELLSTETVELVTTLFHPRRPIARLDGLSELCQWWLPNAAGHRRLVEAAGFDVLAATRPYNVPFGVGHPPRRPSPRMLVQRALTGQGEDGVLHAAVLARPAVA